MEYNQIFKFIYMTTGEKKPHNQYLYANCMISTVLHIGEKKKHRS